MAATVYERTLVKRTLSPATRTNGTVNGVAVDREVKGGAQEVLVAVYTGTITDGSHAVAIEDSADGSTDWQAVAAGQIEGTVPTAVAADDDKVFEVGVKESRRYLRVSVTTSGATSGGAFGAVIVLGDLRFSPIR